ncbi:MAG: hypothetical protein HQ497_06495 [SAR86 cluster bacterium]|uniref:Uncharacterized protein n=1 Tax=SAR86 cluster bacterium TaxID=2030880 RepID=A0A973A9R0_9GAMM|nr:hypothetical protein [SAR86 cluster bacterium]
MQVWVVVDIERGFIPRQIFDTLAGAEKWVDYRDRGRRRYKVIAFMVRSE